MVQTNYFRDIRRYHKYSFGTSPKSIRIRVFGRELCKLVVFTASFAPSGTAETVFGIITIKETNDSIDAANGFSKSTVFR